MFRSIRWRIAVPYIMLTLIIMLSTAAYLSMYSRSAFEDAVRERLLDEAVLVADLAKPLLTPSANLLELERTATRYATVLGAEITIINLRGQVLASSDKLSLQTAPLLQPDVRQAMISGRGAAVVRSTTASANEVMRASAVIEANGQTIAVATVVSSLDEVHRQVSRVNETLVLATALALALTVVLAIAIAQRTAGPIAQLVFAAEQMAQGNLNVRILPTTRDEVARLTGAFNTMADSFQEQMATVADQRNKLFAVVTHMSDGAVILDNSGRVQLMNAAAARILGVKSERVTGDSLTTVARDHQIVAVWQRSLQARTEQSDLVELAGRGPFLRVVATPIEETAGGGSLLILQDLTQVRRLETIRRDFISNISHELRNPLAALKALVETLRGGAVDDRPAADRFLLQMDAEVDAMTQMVRELLELSRIESGRVPFSLGPTSVASALLPAVERLRPQAERAGLSLELALPDDLPLVSADPERLQQALTNLIHNAIKFTPPGGRISVQAEAGDKVTLSVTDTGVGIAQEDLERIFERFYKADRARTGGGTGLGLAIAKHIVQSHGGQIWAESVEGQGATFRLTLTKAQP